MSDNIKVDESYIAALVENGAWDTAGLKIEEQDTLTEEEREYLESLSDEELDALANRTEEDLENLEVEERYDVLKKVDEMRQDESEDEEVHVCPLCESYLEEELSDEILAEHFDNVLEALDELNEEAEEADDTDPKVNEEGPSDEDLDKEVARRKSRIAMHKKKLQKAADRNPSPKRGSLGYKLKRKPGDTRDPEERRQDAQDMEKEIKRKD